MSLQVLTEQLTDLNPDHRNQKTEKVRIIADTVIHADGKGVLVFEGSVLNVRPEVARILYSCIKAVPAKPTDEVVKITQEQCYAARADRAAKKKNVLATTSGKAETK